jgi:hypothetical protein
MMQSKDNHTRNTGQLCNLQANIHDHERAKLLEERLSEDIDELAVETAKKTKITAIFVDHFIQYFYNDYNQIIKSEFLVIEENIINSYKYLKNKNGHQHEKQQSSQSPR